MYSQTYAGITIIVQAKEEYADIINTNDEPVDISEATLNAGDDKQDFKFPKNVILAGNGGKVRVYTNRDNLGPGEYSFNFKKSIWNDAGDIPMLTDANGIPIAVAPYGKPTRRLPPPVISVEVNGAPAAAHDFGSSNIGAEGIVTFTIRNTGGSDLKLPEGVAITGGDAALFSLVKQPARSIPPNGSVTFTVVFRPDAKGLKNAALTIASNDAARGPVQIALSGTGQARGAVLELSATLPLTDSVYDFGAKTIGRESRTETFTVKNTGDSDLVLTGSPPIQADFANSGFTVQGPATTTVPPGGTTTFTVTFAPVGSKRSVAYTIPYGADPVRTYAFMVIGTGVGPEINLKEGTADLAHNAWTRDFGVLQPGQQSGAAALTIENKGDAALQLTGNPPVSIVGQNAGDFQVLSQPEASVPAGGTTSFSVRFAPQSTGVKRAQLSIPSTDLDENPYLVDLSGKAGIQIAGAPRHVAVHKVAGYVLRADGTVWSTPAYPLGISGAVGIYANYHFGLHVLKADGSLWGPSNEKILAGGIVDAALGQSHILVLRDDGTVWARGENWSGQVGTGPARENGFREVQGIQDVVAVVASYRHSIALKADGTVWAWGGRNFGSSGGAIYQIPGLSGVIAVGVNDSNNDFGSSIFAATASGNVSRILYRSDSPPSAIASIMGLSGRPSAVMGSLDQTWSALGLTTTGELWSTGINTCYRLGRGEFARHVPPGPVPGLPPIKAVATNSLRAIALGHDGSVWEWGMLTLREPPPRCYVQSPRRVM